MAKKKGYHSGRSLSPTQIILGVGALGAFFAVVAVMLYQSQARASIDPETWCPNDGPTALVTIAIDASDPFDVVQEREIENRVRSLLGTIEPKHKVEIYTMNAGRGGLATQLFSKCNPGRATRLDQFAGQPNQIEARYREEFANAIRNALAAAMADGAADRSPILESLRAVAADSLGAVAPNVDRRLVVVSDMLQHSDVFSMYREPNTSFETFSLSANFSEASTNLRGAEVDFVIILRSEYAELQNRRLNIWWEQYVRNSNGRVASAEAI